MSNRDERRAAAHRKPAREAIQIIGIPGLPADRQPGSSTFFDRCLQRMVALRRAMNGEMDAADFNHIGTLANVTSSLIKLNAEYRQEALAQHVEVIWEALKAIRARRQRLIDSGRPARYGMTGDELNTIWDAVVALHTFLRTVPLARLGRAETAVFGWHDKNPAYSYGDAA